MAFNPFIGCSQEELETWLKEAQEDYRLGKTVSSVNAGDAGSSKVIQMTPLERIKAILKALNLIDPDVYPASLVNRTTRTQVEVYGNADE